MTAEEKAKEIVNRIYQPTGYLNINESPKKIWEWCKQRSIEFADDIIKQLEEMRKPEYVSFWHGEKAGETIDGYTLIDYWEEVKTEIEKL